MVGAAPGQSSVEQSAGLGWAVTGQQLVARADAMDAVPIPGDLEPVAAEVTGRVMALWRSEGLLDAIPETPFGALPGSVVIDFAIVDAAAHAWTSQPALVTRSSSIRPRSQCWPKSSMRPAPMQPETTI